MRQLDEVLGPKPYTDPPPWPSVRTGDAEIDAVLAELGSSFAVVDLAGEVQNKLKERLREDARPFVQRALLEIVTGLTLGWRDTFYDPEVFSPASCSEDLGRAATDRYNEYCLARNKQFSMLSAALTALPDRPSAEVLAGLVALHARLEAVAASEVLAWYILGMRKSLAAYQSLRDRHPEAETPRDFAEKLVDAWFRADHPSLFIALSVALLLGGPDGLHARTRALLEGDLTDTQRMHVRLTLAKLAWELPLDEELRWLEVLGPTLIVHDGVFFCSPLAKRSPEAILRAFAYPMNFWAWKELTEALRKTDDAALAPRVLEVAATLGVAPPPNDVRLDARHRAGLERIARWLVRDRRIKLPKPPARVQSMSTDGGPILVISAAAARHWRGAPPDYGSPSCPADNDYDRAADARRDGRVAAIQIAKEVALVLPEQVGVARKKPCVWLILEGDDDALVELCFGPEAASFQPTSHRLRVDGPMLLLDAAYAGRGNAQHKCSLKLERGEYAVDELFVDDDRGRAHIVRLRPTGGAAVV